MYVVESKADISVGMVTEPFTVPLEYAHVTAALFPLRSRAGRSLPAMILYW